MKSIEIYLANPRGFCAGVERAIEIVNQVLERYKDQPIYICHEIVHNKKVIEDFVEKGVKFVSNIDEVPTNSISIFSAHGVPKRDYRIAEDKNITYFDATCPLVQKVHLSVARHHKKDYNIILIGHHGHPEVIGTIGQLGKDKITLVSTPEEVEKLPFTPDEDIAYTTQTTLSKFETQEMIDALKKKYPQIKGPDNGDICYATTNRQNGIIDLCKHSELIFVIGSKNSSNSNRLAELAKERGVQSYLIDNKNEIDTKILEGVTKIGISSGASAPEKLVQEVIQFFKENYNVTKTENVLTVKEDVNFPLPMALKKKKSS